MKSISLWIVGILAIIAIGIAVVASTQPTSTKPAAYPHTYAINFQPPCNRDYLSGNGSQHSVFSYTGPIHLTASPTVASPGTVVHLRLVTPHPLSRRQLITLVTGNFGDFDVLRGSSWYAIFEVSTVAVGPPPHSAPLPYTGSGPPVVAGVGLADVPLSAIVPSVPAGTYRFRLQYTGLSFPNITSPLPGGFYQFCATVTVR
jgi:hypothetical protein